MSRIYIVSDRASGDVTYVRAKSLNAAIRAVAQSTYMAAAATTDDVYEAMKGGAKVLDAIEEAPQVDIEIDDAAVPGPVPLRVA